MLRTLAITWAMLGLTIQPSAAAQSAPVSAQESADTYVVAGKDRTAVPLAAWQKKRGILTAAGADAVRKAPRNAVRYDAKIVAWPTATIKVLTFRKANGGVLHPITDETLVYVLEGSAQVSVNGKPVALATGDVASLPSGALTNPGQAVDAVVIAWTAASLTAGATPTVVAAQGVSAQTMGQLTIRRYEFPGNSVRADSMTKGMKTPPNSAKTDSMIYVTRGPMKFTENSQEFTVTAGDFLREVAGVMHNWDVTEESGFVTTSALPLGAGPLDPSKATDRPK